METYDVHITTENRDGKKQDQMAVMSQEQMDCHSGRLRRMKSPWSVPDRPERPSAVQHPPDREQH